MLHKLQIVCVCAHAFPQDPESKEEGKEERVGTSSKAEASPLPKRCLSCGPLQTLQKWEELLHEYYIYEVNKDDPEESRNVSWEAAVQNLLQF